MGESEMTTRKTSKKAAGKKSARSKKAGTKKAGSKKGAATAASKAKGLRVRMYRVGFGDFFLVTVPVAGRDRHIVIDCGVFKGTSQTGDIGTIEAAVEDLFRTTGGKLSLVIM